MPTFLAALLVKLVVKPILTLASVLDSNASKRHHQSEHRPSLGPNLVNDNFSFLPPIECFVFRLSLLILKSEINSGKVMKMG